MDRRNRQELVWDRSLLWTSVLAVGMAPALTGCDALLDVENPNELIQEDVEKPTAAAALVNGALASVARASAAGIVAHDAASDVLLFIGSQTAWQNLEQGDLQDPTNNHINSRWPFIGEARWTADNAVEILSGHLAEGRLANPLLLARARLYSATMYTYIADWWEDFPLESDRRDAGPPVGRENMAQLYDIAIGNLDEALTTARAGGDRELETRILAQRARTKHARALWQKLFPVGQYPSEPLIRDEGMAADARAALDLAGSETWRWYFEYSAGTISNNWGDWVNSRLDMRISDAYVQPTSDGRRVAEVTLEDPIDGVVDPALERRVTEISRSTFDPFTVVSAAELRLLLAEHALAGGDDAGFAEHINAIRAQEGLTPYTGQIAAVELLKHMRRTHLFNQGRRLGDHYRFAEPNHQWLETSVAFLQPGTKFPIPLVEIQANCHLQPAGCP